MTVHRIPIVERSPVIRPEQTAPGEAQATTGENFPPAPRGGFLESRIWAAKMLRERAEKYWRMADSCRDPVLSAFWRTYAITLHTKAVKAEHGIMDDEL
jgi:hypothetical protein